MSGKLYIVPTPVGNLDDMTPRSVETLQKANLILAEDTRTSSVIMSRFNITTPMVSHHKFNEHSTIGPIIKKLENGECIALVSDAGTPAISDPGFLLVRECRSHNITVETLPGPTAFVPALVNSGLACDRFVFEGFLPVKKGRATRLQELSREVRTFIIYESPVRLARTLSELVQVCGPDRKASVSREISKLHDTTHWGTLSELEQYFTKNQPRGEIVIVVEGFCNNSEKKVHKNKYRDSNTDISEN